jgi:hypothetical protein
MISFRLRVGREVETVSSLSFQTRSSSKPRRVKRATALVVARAFHDAPGNDTVKRLRECHALTNAKLRIGPDVSFISSAIAFLHGHFKVFRDHRNPLFSDCTSARIPHQWYRSTLAMRTGSNYRDVRFLHVYLDLYGNRSVPLLWVGSETLEKARVIASARFQTHSVLGRLELHGHGHV